LLYLEHLKAGYRDTKNEINLNLFQLEEILEEAQYKEVVSFLKKGNKMAGTKAADRAKAGFRKIQAKRAPKSRGMNKQGKPNRPPAGERKPSASAVNDRPKRRNPPKADESIQQLAALLSKVLNKN
jgi:hypothetical protein